MKIEAESKYNVGDLVYYRSTVKFYNENKPEDRYSIRPNWPYPMVIVEVVTVTCTAGTQVAYRVRAFSDKGSSLYETVMEVEVTNTKEIN